MEKGYCKVSFLFGLRGLVLDATCRNSAEQLQRLFSTFSCQTLPQKCKLFFLDTFLTFSCQTLSQKCKLVFFDTFFDFFMSDPSPEV